MQGRLQSFVRAGHAGAQLGFELAPGLFDRGKVGRVGQQTQHLYAALGQPRAQPANLMHRQVVEYQYVARAQGGRQAMGYVQGEAVLSQRPFEHLHRAQATYG